jgi:hypothetical protein
MKLPRRRFLHLAAGAGGDLAGAFRGATRRAVAEYLPGYEASVLTGFGAPRDTPADIIAAFNKETNSALADPKIKAQLAAIGNTALPGGYAVSHADPSDKVYAGAVQMARYPA